MCITRARVTKKISHVICMCSIQIFALRDAWKSTKILAGISVLFHASRNANICIEHMQMTWLIFFVTRARVIHIRQPVKRKFTVAFEPFLVILRTLCSSNLFVVLVSRFRAHRIDQAATARNLLKRRVEESSKHAMLKRLMEIPYLPHFIANVALFDAALK